MRDLSGPLLLFQKYELSIDEKDLYPARSTLILNNTIKSGLLSVALGS